MKKKTTQEFIKESSIIHNSFYDYSMVNYLGNSIKIDIICPIHGLFKQKPSSHLNKKGCIQCGYIKKANSHSITRNNKRIHIDYQPIDYKLIISFCGKVFKVDNEDYDLVKKINWSNSKGYAFNSKLGFLHRLIFKDIPEGKYIDHINGDRSDNRKINLRIVTYQQNNHNRVGNLNNKTSKYKGVCWNKKSKKWIVNICNNNIIKYLGCFDSELEAAEIYNTKAIELHGEYAKINIL